jgi:NADPH:quinone reductase-like Zn-dependent oxidoreductase
MNAILGFQLPATVGSDLAGVVLEVGHHVTRFKPGDAVLTSFVLVTCILLFLTATLFLVTKRPFVLRRKLDPS